MFEILKPLTFDDLPTKPPISGRPKVSEDLQQTIALLSGWDGSTRRLIRVSPTGTLYVASPKAKGIINQQASGDADDYQAPNIVTSEVLIKAKTGNSGNVWINVGKAAAANVGYQLLSGDWISFSVNNLNSLQFHFTKNLDWINLLYSE